MADRETAAYFAGFIDGDGSIGAYRVSVYRGRPNFRVRIVADGIDPAPLRMLKAAYGGTIDVKPNRSSGRLQWRWRLNRQQTCRQALTEMLPFLTVKLKQATLALAFLEMTPGGHRRRPGRPPYSDQQIHERQALAGAIAALKREEFTS